MSPPESNECDDVERNAPTIDETLKLLSHPLRRDIIDCCASASDRIHGIGELVETVAKVREEAGEDVNRDQLHLALHHRHLPVLAESGIIDFDPRGGQLRYHPVEDIEDRLREIQTEEEE